VPTAKAIYTPQDEPYLGLESLLHYDKLIVSCLEESAKIAAYTLSLTNKSDLQVASSQIISQTISIALSIRELIRQGYLFGAFVLVRPLVERTIMTLFLSEDYKYKNKSSIDIWKNGWKYNERPSLQKMIDIISQNNFPGVTQFYNSLTHGDPDSAIRNTFQLNGGAAGYSVSKIIDAPALCDRICYETLGWLAALLGIMAKVFPEAFN
jgi:hypothetical protein